MLQDGTIAPATHAALAREHGTPLFVYDSAVLADSYRELRAALPAEMEIFYSLKANPNITVTGILAGLGARAEVSSLVELRTAVMAGVDPRDIIFLGPGKTAEELAACVANGVYAVVVESFAELAELSGVAEDMDVRQRVLVRVNPAAASAGAGLTMGGKPRQFGIDEEQLLAAGCLPDRFPRLDFAGVHVYLGTRILDVEVVIGNTARNLELAERVAGATGIRLDAVDVGGGLGVAYFDGESDPDLARLAEGMADVLAGFRPRYPHTRLLFESGRFLTARSGTYVTRVRYVKQSLGQWFAVADGGTNHHMAAGGIGSYVRRNFPVRLLTAPPADALPPDAAPVEAPAVLSWHVTGPLCTPSDTILTNVTLPRLHPGDLLGIGRSGAYGPTASPVLFLSHGYPAEVLYHQGRAYLVRSRDESVDLIRRQHHHHFRSDPMDRAQVVEQIRTVIATLLGRDLAVLDEDTKLTELGLDSTGVLEMLIELEQHASFEVDADTLNPEVFSTVRSLTDYVMQMTPVR
jgi:diaminopimelate decarboxylase